MEIYKNLSLENLDGEIWKDIEGYNGDYQVSNLGRVKSFKKWCGSNERILRQLNYKGYLFVKLCKNGKIKNKYIHILVYEIFGEKIEYDECIHHIDEDQDNNIYNNLKKMNKFEHLKLHKVLLNEKIRKDYIDKINISNGVNHIYGF